MRLLIICNSPNTSVNLELHLGKAGFNVNAVDTSEEGIELAELYDYDAIILDPDHLPDLKGGNVLSTLKDMRAKKIGTPVAVLTGTYSTEFSLMALGLGADECMQKPVDVDVLIGRVNAIIRRSRGHASSLVKTGNIVINLGDKSVTISGENVHLTGKEYQVFELLSLRKGTILTKEMFLNHLYGGMDEPELKIIDVFICKLRAKLAVANAGEHHIQTVWGRGYVLRDEPAKLLVSKAKKKLEAAAHASVDAGAEVRALQEQLAAIRGAIGANEGDDVATVLAKLAAFKRAADKEAIDEEPHLPNGFDHAEHAHEDGTSNGERKGKHKPAYENGVRKPVGGVFPIGTLIEVDTEELLAGNTMTGDTVDLTSPVAAVLEILTHFTGTSLTKEVLCRALFEHESSANIIRLGQIMTQAQGALTQLVGRQLAAMLIQVTSQGKYGTPDVLAVGGTVHHAAALPAPPAVE